jgi:hypothetical protein
MKLFVTQNESLMTFFCTSFAKSIFISHFIMHLDLRSSPFSLGTLCVCPNLCKSSLQGSFFSYESQTLSTKETLAYTTLLSNKPLHRGVKNLAEIMPFYIGSSFQI